MLNNAQARPKIDAKKLAKFKKAFRLGDITKKAGAIRGKLPAAVSGSLDDRLQQGSLQERAEIDALLHYSYKETKNTTKEGRVNSRTVIANVLGRGLPTGPATTLRDILEDLDDRSTSALMVDLNKDNAFAPNVLANHLLNSRAPDAPEKWNKLKAVLTGFPPEPARAGKIELSNSALTMTRDEDGRLAVTSQALSLLPFTVPDENKGLNAQQLQSVDTIFTQVADVKYSRQGVAFECLGQMRKVNNKRARDGEARLPMRELFENTQVDGAAIAGKYGNGDCMVLAEEMVAQLKAQGITAKLVGYQNSELTRQRVNNQPVDVKSAGLISGGMTHADVVIPYTDASGKERVITITPGMGKADKWKKDLSREEFYQQSDAGNVVPSNRVIGPDGADLDTSAMQKNQLKFLTNIMLTDDKADGPPKDKKICGVDIIKGTVYLNGNASAAFKGPRAAEGQAVSLDLKSMMSHPNTKVTLKLWDAVKQAYEDAEMTNAEALVATLIAIGDQFGQPADFVDNILSLAENLDEYRRDIVAPEISSLHN